MKRYRKRPVVIEAMQYDGTNAPELEKAFGTTFEPSWMDGGRALVIRTLEGQMAARVGNWIIRGTKGELYPITDDIFHETYEAV